MMNSNLSTKIIETYSDSSVLTHTIMGDLRARSHIVLKKVIGIWLDKVKLKYWWRNHDQGNRN